MCVCVCMFVQTITLNRMTFDLDIWHAGSSRSSSKVNVIGQNSRSHDEKMARSNGACYNVTNYGCLSSCFVLKWSVRRRQRPLSLSVIGTAYLLNITKKKKYTNDT